MGSCVTDGFIRVIVDGCELNWSTNARMFNCGLIPLNSLLLATNGGNSIINWMINIEIKKYLL